MKIIYSLNNYNAPPTIHMPNVTAIFPRVPLLPSRERKIKQIRLLSNIHYNKKSKQASIIIASRNGQQRPFNTSFRRIICTATVDSAKTSGDDNSKANENVKSKTDDEIDSNIEDEIDSNVNEVISNVKDEIKSEKGDEIKSKSTNETKTSVMDWIVFKFTEDGKSKSTNETKANAVNDIKSESKDEVKTKATDEIKPKTIEETKSNVIDDEFDSTITNYIKPKEVDDIKSKVTDDIKSKVIDDIKPKIVDDIKPKIVDDIKPKIVDEIEIQTIDDIKSKVAGEIEIQTIDDIKSKVAGEIEIQTIDDIKSKVADEIEIQIVDDIKAKVESDIKPQLVDDAKPQITDDIKPEIADDIKPQLVDDIKPKITDDIKPEIVDDIKSKVIDETEIQTIDDIKHKVPDEIKPKTKESTKPKETVRAKLMTSGNIKPKSNVQIKFNANKKKSKAVDEVNIEAPVDVKSIENEVIEFKVEEKTKIKEEPEIEEYEVEEEEVEIQPEEDEEVTELRDENEKLRKSLQNKYDALKGEEKEKFLKTYEKIRENAKLTGLEMPPLITEETKEDIKSSIIRPYESIYDINEKNQESSIVEAKPRNGSSSSSSSRVGFNVFTYSRPPSSLIKKEDDKADEDDKEDEDDTIVKDVKIEEAKPKTKAKPKTAKVEPTKPVKKEPPPKPKIDPKILRAQAKSAVETHDPTKTAYAKGDWLWFSIPEVPAAGAPCRIYFNKTISESLRHRPRIQISIGYNEWELNKSDIDLKPTIIPKNDGSDWWSVSLDVPEECYEMNFVFTDCEGAYDNNFGQDFHCLVNGGITKEEWREEANERAARALAENLAKEKASKEEAERLFQESRDKQDYDKAQWKLNELRNRWKEFQQGAISKAELEGERYVWKCTDAYAGKKVHFSYNKNAGPFAHVQLQDKESLTLKWGYNNWMTPTDTTLIKRISKKTGDELWEATLKLPVDAVAINFVIQYKDMFDNNNRSDHKILVKLPPYIKSHEDWLNNLLRDLKKQETERRLEEERLERERQKKKAIKRRVARDKALEVGRRQLKHVLFTDPPVLMAGKNVTVYYSPDNTCLNGKTQIYIQGGFNRWLHKNSFGPVKMSPPDEGIHWRIDIEVPQDAFMMDFVFSDVPGGDGTYDNRGGFDYHIPVDGSHKKEPGLHIVHISVEMAPIAKVGGLADVVTSLGRAVKEQGHLVEVIIPRYEFLNGSPLLNNMTYDSEFDWGGTKIYVTTQMVENLRVFFVEPKNHLFSVNTVYGHLDDGEKFEFFCKAALEFMLKTGRNPDIIHCHDWPTAAVAKTFWETYHNIGLNKPRIIFTIHNLNYGEIQIGEAAYYSNRFTTVSPTYSFETSGHPAIAPNVGKFMGIRNGIDMDIWDPENDQFLPMAYNSSNVAEGKKAARMALADRVGLDKHREAPIVGVVSRLTTQKGVHLIKHAAYRVLDRGGIFVLLGSAPDPKLQEEFTELANSLGYAGSNVRFCFAYDEPLSHLIYAASDMILVPSMFEPCGLTQLIAMRFGSVPVVRETGGLKDTVFDVDNDKPRAAWEMAGSSDWEKDNLDCTNGFSFSGTDTGALDYALNRAIDAWYNNRQWFLALQKRVMDQDWSWNRPALDYIELYHAAMK